MNEKPFIVSFTVTLAALALAGCTVNPVTGESELSLVSEQQELEIGRQQYEPSLQSQGGAYQVDEALGDYVSEVGQRVAEFSDRDLPYEFTVLNNGVPNAWALPGGKISINRGLLLELDNEAELAAVLGHEVVHAAARHGAQAVTRGTLLQGALAVGALASRGNEYSDFIVGGAQLGAQLINQSYSREAELEADHYGMEYMLRAGYDPNAAVSLQETFVRLSEGRNQSWLEGLFASHPPSQERVEQNRAHVDELRERMGGRDLILGEDRYQQAIAFLRESEPAYDLFQQAREDIGNDNLEAAMDKLRQAEDMIPGEARFIGLQADILLNRGQFSQAVSRYDEAIEFDPRYYDYYLGRGVAYARMGDNSQARRDLEQSADLLPTAVAMNELGKLSVAAENREEAKEYFRMAASGQGQVAQEASRAFTRLDIRDNPGNYVRVSPVVDNAGRLLARVTNRTGFELAEIAVEFDVTLAGRTARQRRVLASLAPGATVSIDSGLSMASAGAGLEGVSVVVRSARVRQ